MGYKYNGHALKLVNPQQLVVHKRPCLRVESRERFVHQENAWIGYEAPGKRHTASHAAGKLVRERFFESFQLDEP